MKICLLSYRSNPHSGGQGVYVANLSRALVNLGHRVDVVSGPPDPMLDEGVGLYRLPCLDLYNPADPFRVPKLEELADPVNLIEWLGVSTMGFPEPFTFGLRAYRFLQKRFHEYDIVHDNQSLSYGVWAIGTRVPAIATIHHPITMDRDIALKTTSSTWKKLKHLRWHSFVAMQKRVARTFSNIITVSKAAKIDIGKAYSIPKKRFRIILNGIDAGLFRPLPEITRENNRVIVTNSADIPLKGLYYLLRAVAKIAGSRKIKLIVIGSPKKNGGIEKLVAELGIAGSIVFTGRIGDQEFVRQYARASVAVVPSVYEGFGLHAGEAMACGVPVIATTGGALPEVVGKAGALVPPADPEALEKEIVNLLDNPEYAGELGRKGFNRVHKLFTWERAAKRTVKAYRTAIRDFYI